MAGSGGWRECENENDGEQRTASQIIVHPNYLATSGYDISLIRLSQSSTMAPTQVAGAGERSLWTAGTLETIVGWGVTEEFLRASFAEPAWVDTEIEQIEVAAELGDQEFSLRGFLLRTVRAFEK